MVLFLVAIAAGCAFIADTLVPIFMVNPTVNGVIFAVILIGTILNFRQVILLAPEARWVDRLRESADEPAAALSELRAEAVQPQLRLLTPMARMLGEKRGRLMLSAPAMRTILDSIASRLEESRDLARYLTGLCIFLGLLGTFWGLLGTIRAIADVIGGMTMNTDDLSVMFNTLKQGLQSPLSGMGTAFASSLFGLGG